MIPRPIIAGPDGKVHAGTVFRAERTGELREVVAVQSAGDFFEAEADRQARLSRDPSHRPSALGMAMATLGPVTAHDQRRIDVTRRRWTKWSRKAALLAVLSLMVGCATVTAPPVTLPADHPAPELWLHANVGSSDLQTLLSPTGLAQAPVALGRMTTYQFHAAQLVPGCYGLRTCSMNRWENLAPAIAWLRERGYAISVEAGAVKEWDCAGDVLRADIAGILDRVRLDAVSMDWPFAVAAPCGLSDAQIAERIRAFADVVHGHGARLILTEGYPSYGPVALAAHLDALAAAGVTLSAVHLDVDFPATTASVRHELPAIVQDIRRRGLVAAFVVWGVDGSSTATFGRTAREQSRNLLQGVLRCDVDRVVVESWARVGDDPARADLKIWPLNLPESNPDTLTGLARTEACQ